MRGYAAHARLAPLLVCMRYKSSVFSSFLVAMLAIALVSSVQAQMPNGSTSTPTPRLVSPTPSSIPGDGYCASDAECGSGLHCQATYGSSSCLCGMSTLTAVSCGGVQPSPSPVPVPGTSVATLCTQSFYPVCSSTDGRTYPSICYAKAANVHPLAGRMAAASLTCLRRL